MKTSEKYWRQVALPAIRRNPDKLVASSTDRRCFVGKSGALKWYELPLDSVHELRVFPDKYIETASTVTVLENTSCTVVYALDAPQVLDLVAAVYRDFQAGACKNIIHQQYD